MVESPAVSENFSNYRTKGQELVREERNSLYYYTTCKKLFTKQEVQYVLPLTTWENLILLPQLSQRKLSLRFLFCCSSTTRLREVLSIAAWWSFSISFCSSTLFDRADFKLALCSNSWMSDSILLLYIIVYITTIEDYSIHEFIFLCLLWKEKQKTGFTSRIDRHHGLVESPRPVHDVKIWNAPWLDQYLQNLSCMKNNDKLSSSYVKYHTV